MGTKINPVNIRSFFAQKGFQTIMYFLKGFKGTFPSCNDGLIGDDNRQITRPVKS